MKRFYNEALKVIADIEQIKAAIAQLSLGGVDSNYLLRTDNDINGSYVYANVRTSNYIKLLHGELKDMEKDLKVIESAIKTAIN